MGNCCALFKARRDSYVSSEVLPNQPNEILWDILSYLDNKTKLNVSLVNLRWFQIINDQIERLSIRTPRTTENLEEIQNLINRFPRIRSLTLANRINDLSELVPLKSLTFKDFSLEFDVHVSCFPTKHPATQIRRVKLEDSKDFENLQYNPSQLVIHFEVSRPIRFEMEEEIMSLNRIERILIDLRGPELRPGMDHVISRRLIEAILTRPNLKQIDFEFLNLDFNSNIEQKFSKKNFTVEEITFSCYRSKPLNLELLKQLFDALPNTKRVRVILFYPLVNMLEFLKIISDLKNLKSLHFAMHGLKNSGVQKIQDCCNIIDKFPIKAKVVIADIDYYYNSKLKNILVKEEGKPTKRVQSHSRYPLFRSTFWPKPLFR